jgi:cytochrome c
MGKNIFLGLVVIALCTCISMEAFAQEKNNPPVVKILEPLTKSSHNLNTQVHYRIKVSDQEDGESEYDEIAANEVFLEVRYLPDASKADIAISATEANGLADMKKSNCFNCHAFNGKLIAPSFYEITKRYAPTSSNKELLTKHIVEGSSGMWGSASMPSHTELTKQEAQDIVNWIFENAEDPNLNYYIGSEGNIRIKAPEGTGQKGAFILTATYSDHGTQNNPKQNLSSKDVIVLYVK